MKILITGGAGFIGLHLAKALHAQGHHLTLVDDFSRGHDTNSLTDLAAQGRVRTLSLDLTHADSWDSLAADFDEIYHLAAIVGVSNVLRAAYAVLDRNIFMTTAALGLARRQHALSRFVFASTSEVYAGSLLHMELLIPTPETTALALPDLSHPRTSYMLSKIYGEALCHQAGIPFTIVRPHNVYGPRMGYAHVIPELLERASGQPDGGELAVYSPSHMRTFCYIDDAVAMMMAAARADQGVGATFNIGRQEEEITIAELAARVACTVGRRLNIRGLDDTPGSPTRRCPSIAAIAAAAGVTPRVSLDEGLELTWRWYKDNPRPQV